MRPRVRAPGHASLLLALAACGRLGFDDAAGDGAPGEPDAATAPDADGPAACAAPVGHDEDADGVDDACDVCPQRGASQADTDGDGVGDDCDPDGTVVHTRTLFEPFLAPNAAWTYDGRHQFVGDALRTPLDPGPTVLRLPGAPAPAVFEIAGRVGARGASGDHLVSISFGPVVGGGGYYCELYDGVGGFALQLTQTPDGVNYTNVDTAAIPGTMAGAPFRLAMIHTPPTARCAALWGGQAYQAAGAVPDLGALQQTTFFPVINVEVELDYAVRLDLP